MGKGDYGQMYPIGHHAKGFEMKQYAAPSHPSDIPKLQKAVTAASKLASVTVPAVVQVIQDLKDDAAVPRLAGMHGEKNEVKRIEGRRVLEHRFCFLSHAMDLSVNLANHHILTLTTLLRDSVCGRRIFRIVTRPGTLFYPICAVNFLILTESIRVWQSNLLMVYS